MYISLSYSDNSNCSLTLLLFQMIPLERFCHWTEENITMLGFLTLHQSLVLEAKQNSLRWLIMAGSSLGCSSR